MDIERELENIKERNKKVELDKAWETSWTRRMFISVATYIFAFIWLVIIDENKASLKALVPVLGYILSTLTLPVIRQKWAGVKDR